MEMIYLSLGKVSVNESDDNGYKAIIFMPTRFVFVSLC